MVFHPVWTDARVQYPSHLKRFEVQMFAFTENEEDLSPQVTQPVKKIYIYKKIHGSENCTCKSVLIKTLASSRSLSTVTL